LEQGQKAKKAMNDLGLDVRLGSCVTRIAGPNGGLDASAAAAIAGGNARRLLGL
jgi:hypothetical protein